MAQKFEAQGEYKDKESGETIYFPFEYTVYAGTKDGIEGEGEANFVSAANRHLKTDARNKASVKAQAANGHNQRAGATEEEKVALKAKKAADKALLDKIRGLTDAQREALGI